MKKLLMTIFIPLAGIVSLGTIDAVYVTNMDSNNPIMTVNGLEYECKSPNKQVVGNKVYCNGIEINPISKEPCAEAQQPSKLAPKHFPVKNIRKVVAKAITGTIHIEQCPNPDNCIEGFSLLGDISPLLQVTTRGNELVFDSKKGFAEMPHINCRLTVKKMENIVNYGPANIINIRRFGASGSMSASCYGSGSISSTTDYFN